MAEVSEVARPATHGRRALDRPRLLVGTLTLPALDVEERQAVIANLLRAADLAGTRPKSRPDHCRHGVVQALPEPYQKLVHDSSLLLFSSLPDARLVDKIAAQLALPPGSPVGQRVVLLIEDMPTLQKLGQTVARSPLIGVRVS
jgi:hypothetical protein